MYKNVGSYNSLDKCTGTHNTIDETTGEHNSLAKVSYITLVKINWYVTCSTVAARIFMAAMDISRKEVSLKLATVKLIKKSANTINRYRR